MKSLGKTLKEKRESIGFTLRQVEDTTGISNASSPSISLIVDMSILYKLRSYTCTIVVKIWEFE